MKNNEVLKCARVSKSWKRRCFDSGLWKLRYELTWPEIARLEGNFLESNQKDRNEFSMILNDWYHVYKDKYIADKNFEVVIVDIGSTQTKYSKVSSNNKSFPTIVARFKGHYWATNSGMYHYCVGEEIKSMRNMNYYFPRNLFKKSGEVDNITVTKILNAVMERGFAEKAMTQVYYSGLQPSQHPILLAVDSEFAKSPAFDSSFISNHVSSAYVCIMDPALLALYAKGIPTGIVVSVGHVLSRVSIVSHGEVLKSYIFPFSGQHLTWKEDFCEMKEISEKFFSQLNDSLNIAKVAFALASEFKEFPVLLTNIVMAGIPAYFIQDLFYDEIAKFSLGARVLKSTFDECKYYAVDGGKAFCKLSSARSFFKNRFGAKPSLIDLQTANAPPKKRSIHGQ